MVWKRISQIMQYIGGLVVVGAILMGDNEAISTDAIVEKILIGCMIVAIGLAWECFVSWLYHERQSKRIRKKSYKPYKEKKKSA